MEDDKKPESLSVDPDYFRSKLGPTVSEQLAALPKKEHKVPTIFTFMDLEMNQPSGKIIMLGACVGNISTGEIIDKLSIFVNPEEQVTEYITNLTGITQAQVDSGVHITEAYDKFVEFHKKYKSFVNVGQWGTGDIRQLLQQVRQHREITEHPFGRREIDVKTLYVAYRAFNGEHPSGGLKKAHNRLKVKFQGPAHNALNDAVGAFNMFCALGKLYKQKEK